MEGTCVRTSAVTATTAVRYTVLPPLLSLLPPLSGTLYCRRPIITATGRVRTSAAGYTVPPPSTQHRYRPCSHHCCRVHCAAAVHSTQLPAVFAPLLPGTLCRRRPLNTATGRVRTTAVGNTVLPLTTATGHSLPSTHCRPLTATIHQP